MKKKIALLLVMTTLVLTACGAPKQDVNTDMPQSGNVVESTEETPSSSEEAKPEIKAYVPGTITDNKFVSSYAGYTFTAPEGCAFMSAEEIAAENGIDADTFAAGGEALANAYEQASGIVEFNASTETGNNVYMRVAQMLTYGITLEEYTQIIVEELTTMEDVTCTVVEETKIVEFVGKQCSKTLVSIEMDGLVLYQQYFMFIEPTYTGTITVTYVEGYEAERDALLAGFAAK